jgi:hypothetical protein
MHLVLVSVPRAGVRCAVRTGVLALVPRHCVLVIAIFLLLFGRRVLVPGVSLIFL